MKKLLVLIMSGVIVAAGYTAVKGSPYQVINKQEQRQLDQFKEQQNRAEEIKQLHSPQYIEGELRKVGKLVTLEGTYQYQTPIDEKGVWGYVTLREMTLDLAFHYGIGVDLSYIKVSQSTDKILSLSVPKSRMQLMYIELLSDKSMIKDGKKMIFADQFKPSEVEVALEQSQENVANRIGNNKKYFDVAMSNLKMQLQSWGKQLGYEKVTVEEV